MCELVCYLLLDCFVQTPSIGLPHPSFSRCRIWLCHRSQKTVQVVFLLCSDSSKFVTNNSDYIKRLFYVAMLLTPAQIKPKLFELRQNFFFKPEVDVSYVYVC